MSYLISGSMSAPVVLALVVVANLIGFVFGVAAALPPGRLAPMRVRAGEQPRADFRPFPVDTGPLLLWSEQAAAEWRLGSDVDGWISEAEAKIPARWR